MDKTFPSNLGDILVDSVNFGDTDLTTYVEGSYTPIVTLTGGTGNTVPQYITNTGRYVVIGRRCFVDINLTGDGGDEGAGTGQLSVSLPVVGPSSAANTWQAIGMYRLTSYYPLWGYFSAGASTILLMKLNISTGVQAALTGDDQNVAARTLRMCFSYEV